MRYFFLHAVGEYSNSATSSDTVRSILVLEQSPLSHFPVSAEAPSFHTTPFKPIPGPRLSAISTKFFIAGIEYELNFLSGRREKSVSPRSDTFLKPCRHNCRGVGDDCPLDSPEKAAPEYSLTTPPTVREVHSFFALSKSFHQGAVCIDLRFIKKFFRLL